MLKKIIRLITFYTQSNNKEIIKLLFEPKWKFYLYLDWSVMDKQKFIVDFQNRLT